MVGYNYLKSMNLIKFSDTDVIVARFICVSMLHMVLFPECRQGVNVMKYSLNHKEEFCSYKTVFIVGFMQFIMVICVEVVNMFYICIANDITEVIMNFIALAIIAEFDDMFYKALPPSEFNNLDEVFTIKKTSSSQCKPDEKVKIKSIKKKGFKVYAVPSDY